MSGISGDIRNFNMDGHVHLAANDQAQDICDTLIILGGDIHAQRIMFTFNDHAGTLAHTLDTQVLRHIPHSTITDSPNNKIGVMLVGDAGITTGLKALFKTQAQDIHGQPAPLVSATMQAVILRECSGLLVRAGAPHLADTTATETPEPRLFD